VHGGFFLWGWNYSEGLLNSEGFLVKLVELIMYKLTKSGGLFTPHSHPAEECCLAVFVILKYLLDICMHPNTVVKVVDCPLRGM
jgi:hypothetical protein